VTEQHLTKILIKEEEDVLCTIIPNGSEWEDGCEEPDLGSWRRLAALCFRIQYIIAEIIIPIRRFQLHDASDDNYPMRYLQKITQQWTTEVKHIYGFFVI
jgi:hypothetical protein